MEFNFSEYYGRLVISPGLFIAVSLLVLLLGIIKYKRALKHKDIEHAKGHFVFSAISFLLIFSLGFFTMNFDLVLEKDDSRTLVEGDITAIKNTNYPIKFTYDNSSVNPSFIMIDGEEYLIMYIGEFEVGDSVVIEYLPNSHIILSINYSP